MRSYSLIFFAFPSNGQECASEDTAKVCRHDCEVINLACTEACPDEACINQCKTEQIECLNYCPCGDACVDGCPCPFDNDYCPPSECKETHAPAYRYCVDEMQAEFVHCTNSCTPFDVDCHATCSDGYSQNLASCPCMAGCPDGCPCAAYNCHHDDAEDDNDHDDIYALIINPMSSDNVYPNVSQVNYAFIDRDVDFDESWIDDNFMNDRKRMCAFSNKGQMMIAGGDRDSANPRRLFTINGNKVEQLDDLPFDFQEGNIGFTNEVVFCASFANQKECHVWAEDGTFTKTRATSDSHYLGGLARYKSSVIIFTGKEDGRGTTEMLQENKWTSAADRYRDFKSRSFLNLNFSTVTFMENVYMFGGTDSDRQRQLNKCYFYDGKWHKIQSLQVNRSGHTSIIAGEKIMHFGGDGETKSEVWTWSGKTTFSSLLGLQTFEYWSKFPYAFSLEPKLG